MFLIINNLCTTYAGLNPITLEKEPFEKVIFLYADVRRMQIREENKSEASKKGKVIRRYASDDAGWW